MNKTTRRDFLKQSEKIRYNFGKSFLWRCHASNVQET
jgi:hypothetical protein